MIVVPLISKTFVISNCCVYVMGEERGSLIDGINYSNNFKRLVLNRMWFVDIKTDHSKTSARSSGENLDTAPSISLPHSHT